MALSLLAEIDLLTGKIHALVRDRHRSRELIEFLKLLDDAYPAGTAIKLILDNHSAHISRETRAWLDTRPASRFHFTFTPKHGSWLLIVGATSIIKLAKRGLKVPLWVRSMLQRRPVKVDSVALANKVARTIWALLVMGGVYQAPAAMLKP
ncbi:transposase [Bradyrhizobium sp. LB7.2]